jgi:hypothetical protein
LARSACAVEPEQRDPLLHHEYILKVDEQPRRSVKRNGLGGGFGAENAAEAGTGELYANDFVARRLSKADVNNTAASGEIGFVAASHGLRRGDANFQITTDG